MGRYHRLLYTKQNLRHGTLITQFFSLICQPMPEISGVSKLQWTSGHPVVIVIDMNQWVLLSNNEGIGDRMTTIKSDCHIIRGALYCSDFTLLPVLGMHCVQSSFPVRAISSPFSYSTRVEYRVFDQRNFRGRICRRGIMGGAVSLDFGGGDRAGGRWVEVESESGAASTAIQILILHSLTHHELDRS